MMLMCPEGCVGIMTNFRVKSRQIQGQASSESIVWLNPLLVGTRTSGDVAELWVQEAGVAMDPSLAGG